LTLSLSRTHTQTIFVFRLGADSDIFKFFQKEKRKTSVLCCYFFLDFPIRPGFSWIFSFLEIIPEGIYFSPSLPGRNSFSTSKRTAQKCLPQQFIVSMTTVDHRR
jgi:hypothetical protein